MGIEYNRFVPGTPVAQPRQRHRGFVNKDNKVQTQNYTPAKHPVQEWKSIIQTYFLKGGLHDKISGPIKLNLFFIFPRPKSHYRTGKNSHLLKDSAPKYWHIQTPDSDNMKKAVMDALTGLEVWNDDCQVCSGNIDKVWTFGEDDRPGCYIHIQELK